MARYIAAGEGKDPRGRTKMILSHEKEPSAYKMMLWLQWCGPPLTPAPGFDYKANEILEFCYLTWLFFCEIALTTTPWTPGASLGRL